MRNLHVDHWNVSGTYKLLTEKNLRNFLCKTFITANNKKLRNRFHSFTAKYHIDAFIKLLSSIFCAFGLDLLPSLKENSKCL